MFNLSCSTACYMLRCFFVVAFPASEVSQCSSPSNGSGAINIFNPLITCMRNALHFFNYSTPVLTVLNKLMKWQSKIKNTEEIVDINTAENESKELIDFNIFDENYLSFNRKVLNKYNTEKHNNIFGCFNIRHKDLKENIAKGVQKFCIDLGFDGFDVKK
ncbi:uncharacterized protein LOC126908706 [Daktulosphaira vitifoliae]|uniref:uncharacterized protein LOC126908706 n=1 Tax=Daktulosphaira vitifoliae TaxID=58002 RepID=UPI0021AAAE47|nr:uncharacterized protein LOC126908706 [Daktulosphaira vitifoliae]